MKLLVIVLCLLSERFLVHAVSFSRFYWFSSYFNAICDKIKQKELSLNPFLILAIVIVPLFIVCGLVFLLLGHLLFGFISLVLNIFIFYYCLGPENPFYPIRQEADAKNPEDESAAYLTKANDQLFAVVFWYIATGALGVLLYRLISLCREQELTAKIAIWITNILNWIPARITVLLYLLVGNFQKGLNFFIQHFLSSPGYNDTFLSNAGLLAARTNESEPVQMPYAESLVEHAVIVYLVLLAFFTLVAWL